MSSTNDRIKTSDITDSPLQIFQPFNVLVWFSFFSPIVLATGITTLSFIFQNFKGLIYLGFLVGSCFLRYYLYMIGGAPPNENDGTICTSIQYSKYGNASFSAFVFAFTIAYIAIPMFDKGVVNFWILSSLLLYFCVDIYIKFSKICISNYLDLGLNIVLGGLSSAFIIYLMYLGGSGKYLFFNETSSKKDVCYQPSKQTFKCSMYKNGELINEL
jgi:hypothetical protein